MYKAIEKTRTQTERVIVERPTSMEASVKAKKENHEIGSQLIVFQVENIICTNCAAKLERNIQTIPGVTKATLNIRTGRLIVEGLGGLETFEAVRDQGRNDNYILSLIELKLF